MDLIIKTGDSLLDIFDAKYIDANDNENDYTNIKLFGSGTTDWIKIKLIYDDYETCIFEAKDSGNGDIFELKTDENGSHFKGDASNTQTCIFVYDTDHYKIKSTISNTFLCTYQGTGNNIDKLRFRTENDDNRYLRLYRKD